jgi:hypothetical protein
VLAEWARQPDDLKELPTSSAGQKIEQRSLYVLCQCHLSLIIALDATVLATGLRSVLL